MNEIICGIVRNTEELPLLPCLPSCKRRDFTYNGFYPNEPKKYGFKIKEVFSQRCFVYDLALERELTVTLHTQQDGNVYLVGLKEHCRNDERWHLNVLEEEI